jgi:hypothetical protein
LNSWFTRIRDAVPNWWELGAAEGGGLAMNDGVTICLMVLRTVFQHLAEGKARLSEHSAKEIVERLDPYAAAMADYLSEMTPAERDGFRGLRGNQGHAAGMRHAQSYIQSRMPSFQPEGLNEFLEREKARTNEQASARIKAIERSLQHLTIGALKAQFGSNGDRWWYDGVPKQVRNSATTLQEEDRNSRGSRERYLYLIDYRSIALFNWTLLAPILAYGKAGNKERRTEWMVRVNEIRKVAEHASSGQWVSFEELAELDRYLTWLSERASGNEPSFGSDSIEDPDREIL